MNNKRINLNICGRNYPLNINPKEEYNLRKVGKLIDEMIKEYEAKFDIKDKQDALAMCAIKLGINAEIYKNTSEHQMQSFNNMILTLIDTCSETENLQ
jgi:cell division protein ZapA (FtsZ GTPase activity inhibitor)